MRGPCRLPVSPRGGLSGGAGQGRWRESEDGVSVTGWPCTGSQVAQQSGPLPQGSEPLVGSEAAPVRESPAWGEHPGPGLGFQPGDPLTWVCLTGRKRRARSPWPRGTWHPRPSGPLSVPWVEHSGLRPPQLGDCTGPQASVVMPLPKARPCRARLALSGGSCHVCPFPTESQGLPENPELPSSGPEPWTCFCREEHIRGPGPQCS